MSDAPRSILLVDDDVDICAHMADVLVDLGGRVDMADEGVTALELVPRRTRPVAVSTLMAPVDEVAGRPPVPVVDDETDLHGGLRAAPREYGFRVGIAHDEPEAIERLWEATRVVLLDLRRPGRDGSTVSRRLREGNPSARVDLITGCLDEMGAVVGELLTAGVDVVPYKLFDIARPVRDVGHLAGGGRVA